MVLSELPAAGWTTMPGSLFMTMISSSSCKIRSGISCGSGISETGSGKVIEITSPLETDWRAFTVALLSRMSPLLIKPWICPRDISGTRPTRNTSIRWGERQSTVIVTSQRLVNGSLSVKYSSYLDVTHAVTKRGHSTWTYENTIISKISSRRNTLCAAFLLYNGSQF